MSLLLFIANTAMKFIYICHCFILPLPTFLLNPLKSFFQIIHTHCSVMDISNVHDCNFTGQSLVLIFSFITNIWHYLNPVFCFKFFYFSIYPYVYISFGQLQPPALHPPPPTLHLPSLPGGTCSVLLFSNFVEEKT
jgi:hypothetical protein